MVDITKKERHKNVQTIGTYSTVKQNKASLCTAFSLPAMPVSFSCYILLTCTSIVMLSLTFMHMHISARCERDTGNKKNVC